MLIKHKFKNQLSKLKVIFDINKVMCLFLLIALKIKNYFTYSYSDYFTYSTKRVLYIFCTYGNEKKKNDTVEHLKL